MDDKVDVDFEKKDGLRLRVRVVGSVEFDDMGRCELRYDQLDFSLLGSLNILSTLIYRS